MVANLVERLRGEGSSSIGYAVYPRRLNNNGLKSPHIGICIRIDSKAMWRSHDVPLPHWPSQHRKSITVAGNVVRITVRTSVGPART
ncbi:hypothetical protein ACTXT7_012351 [Hymenolepis weldensis]